MTENEVLKEQLKAAEAKATALQAKLDAKTVEIAAGKLCEKFGARPAQVIPVIEGMVGPITVSGNVLMVNDRPLEYVLAELKDTERFDNLFNLPALKSSDTATPPPQGDARTPDAVKVWLDSNGHGAPAASSGSASSDKPRLVTAADLKFGRVRPEEILTGKAKVIS